MGEQVCSDLGTDTQQEAQCCEDEYGYAQVESGRRKPDVYETSHGEVLSVLASCASTVSG